MKALNGPQMLKGENLDCPDWESAATLLDRNPNASLCSDSHKQAMHEGRVLQNRKANLHPFASLSFNLLKMADDSPFAFPGLWDRWLDQDNKAIETCTILTTRPNSLVADVHDRMPVMLRPEDYDLWLDPGITDAKRVVDCLKPFDSTLMKKYPVSTLNRPENDDQECAREIPLAAPALRLF